jgi:hypothetical protein
VGFVSIVFLSPFPIVFPLDSRFRQLKIDNGLQKSVLVGPVFSEGADLNWSSIPAPVERRYAMVGNGEFAIADEVILPV